MKKVFSFVLFFIMIMGGTTYASGWDDLSSLFLGGERPPTVSRTSFWDDLWSDPFGSSFSFSFPSPSFHMMPSGGSHFPLDLEETDDLLIATIDVTGLDPAYMHIDVRDDRYLVLSFENTSEKSKDSDENGRTFHYRERSQGSFSRQVYLPSPVDKSLTEAVWKSEENTLIITLPKKDDSFSSGISIDIQ